jgi:hypothetical protein
LLVFTPTSVSLCFGGKSLVPAGSWMRAPLAVHLLVGGAAEVLQELAERSRIGYSYEALLE